MTAVVNYHELERFSIILMELPRRYRGAGAKMACNCSDCIRIRKMIETDFVFKLRVFGTCHWVDAGCRDMTISDYRRHVASSYPGTPKAVATLAILKRFERALAAHLCKELPNLSINPKKKIKR